MKPTILIEVRGGNIVNIISTTKDIHIKTIDHDLNNSEVKEHGFDSIMKNAELDEYIKRECKMAAVKIQIWQDYNFSWFYDNGTSSKKDLNVEYSFHLKINFDEDSSDKLTWQLIAEDSEYIFEGNFELSPDGRGGNNIAAIGDMREMEDITNYESLLEKITELASVWIGDNPTVGAYLHL